ncbi:MAG: hypothetical protein AB7I25_01635 [Vicinamibacterales bacterium]
MTPRRWAWVLVIAVTATLGWFMTRIPIQLTDGASNMMSVVDQGAWEVFIGKMDNQGYFRPLMWPPYVFVMQVSGGAYFAWFKAIHIAQVLVLLALFLRWLRVETTTDAVAFAFGVAVLVGGHTFPGTVREAFPINHFLVIAICVLGTAVLASEPRRRLNDAMAVLLFVYAALTIESGLLVWAAGAAALALGWRGLSRTAVALMTAGVVAYLVVRFGWFHNGTPSLVERSSGFGFGMLDAEEIQRRFGDRALVFYAYNLSAAVLTMLTAEPRGAIYYVVRGLVQGTRESWAELNAFCATGVTVLIGVTYWLRQRDWREGLTHHDRILLMAPVLVVANAAFCYAYVKDVVLSTAGVFVAAAAAVAMREVLMRAGQGTWRRSSAVAAAALLVLSSAWAIKLVGIHFSIRKEAIAVRREWAMVDDWVARTDGALDSPAKRRLKEALEADALRKTPVAPWPALPWPNDWFDETQ